MDSIFKIDKIEFINLNEPIKNNTNYIADKICQSLIKNQINYVYLKKQKYGPVWDLQKKLHSLIIEYHLPDIVLFLEHNHVYTFGKNADENFLLDSYNAEIVKTDRGGQVTYHGPGQLICYPLINLNHYKKSVSWFMRSLEQVIIDTLNEINIQSSRKEGFPGVWVEDEKICAMGIRIAKWVTMHGFALNINPNMSYYDGIIPCGIFEHGITSIKSLLKVKISNNMIIKILMEKFNDVFKRLN